MCMCTPSTTSTKTRGVHSSRVEHPQPAPDVLGWERVRLSERLHRGAGRVEPRDVGRVEPPRERAQVILELPQVARARDGSRPLGDTPVDGHLRKGGAAARGESPSEAAATTTARAAAWEGVTPCFSAVFATASTRPAAVSGWPLKKAYPSRAEMSRACPRCPEGGRRTALASSARGPSGSCSAEYLPLSNPRPMGE